MDEDIEDVKINVSKTTKNNICYFCATFVGETWDVEYRIIELFLWNTCLLTTTHSFLWRRIFKVRG